MGSGRAPLGLLLGAGALVVLTGAWLLTRSADTAATANGEAVLARIAAAPTAAAPELPAGRAPDEAPERLGEAAHDASPGTATAPRTASGAAAAAMPGAELLFTGRVIDVAGAPLPGVVVRHVPTRTLRRPLGLISGRSSLDLAWELLPQAVTGDDGRFAFRSRELERDPEAPPDPDDDDFRRSVIGGGTPGLLVRHPGFAYVLLACEGWTSGAYDAGDITLSPAAAVTGRLVDTQGAPIADVRVGAGRFNHGERFLQASTGPDGRFFLDCLRPGSVRLEFEHADFRRNGARATLAAGSVTDIGTIDLEPARHIRGAVLGADGQPLSGARILARPSTLRLTDAFGDADPLRQELGSATGEDEETATDARGTFDIGSLSATHYDVFVQALGQELVCERDVLAGTHDVLFRLHGQALLVVTAVDADTREPLAGATVEAWRHADVKSLFGDMRGAELEVLAGEAAARAAGLPGDGAGLAVVHRPGESGTVLAVSAPGHATEAHLVPGVREGGKDFQTVALRRGTTLALRVEDEQGAPVAGATLTLRRDAGTETELPERTDVTDAQGRAEFPDLLSGPWKASARAKGFLDLLPLDLLVEERDGPQDAAVTLRRGAALTGLLLDADGAPASQVEVFVTSPEGSWKGRRREEMTSSQGRFGFEVLPPGLVRVSADPGAELELVLEAGATHDVTLALRRRPLVRGRVTRAGLAVSGATVRGTAPSAERPTGATGKGHDGKAVTSAAGEYALELEVPGMFAVRAEADGARSRVVIVTTAWDRAELVDLALGTLSLHGVVTDAATMLPVFGAFVALRDAAPASGAGDAAQALSAELSRSAQTDEQGRFAFEGVPPGAFEMRVQAAGYLQASSHGSLPAEGSDAALQAALAIALQPGPRLQGTLRLASGKPLYADLVLGLETADLDALKNSVPLGTTGHWTWTRELLPGAATLKLWRSTSAELGVLDPADVLVTLPIDLASGETRVVDLVVED
jgi:protocatechuate 3,4-dioxygenase beta subunit/5-hydroxyisourate hydrolase-like protein (transthyretin family)